MDKKRLTEAGLTDAQVTEVLKLHKEVLDNQFIPKHRFDEVNEELKTAKTQVAERDTQIKELKEFKGNAETLKAKIAELEAANTQKDAEYQKTLATERKRNAVKMALMQDEQGKPHDLDLVLGMMDLEKITLGDDGSISGGYKEQNENIRKEKAFLFAAKANPNPNPNPFFGNPPKNGDPNPNPNPTGDYGKGLAAVKLGMMGISAEGNK